jgi:hypothetical protein
MTISMHTLIGAHMISMHTPLDPAAVSAAKLGVELAGKTRDEVQAFYDTHKGPSPYAAARWPMSKMVQRFFIHAFVGELERIGHVIYVTPAAPASKKGK